VCYASKIDIRLSVSELANLSTYLNKRQFSAFKLAAHLAATLEVIDQ